MPYAIQGHFDLKFQHVIDVFLAQLPQEPKVGGAALTVYHENKKVVDVWAGVHQRRQTVASR